MLVFRAPVILVALCFALVDAATPAEESISIGIAESEGEGVIVVRGLAREVIDKFRTENPRRAELSDVLKIYAGEKPSKVQPPVLGTVKLVDGQVVFQPRFPLRPGMAYRVVLASRDLSRDADVRDGPGVLERIVHVPRDDAGEPPVVSAVYPSGEVLPENLLKFYVHFSAPMQQGDVYGHVRLVDEKGEAVDYPFVNVGQELWDRSGTRITLLLDPGRIKRGLRPREELGPILHEGRDYELVVDGAWRDAHGRPLGADVRKRFRVAAPDDVQPDPAKWKVEPPAAGTTSPLSIRFEESLDHAMLSSSFDVFDERRREIAGKIQIDGGETMWQFVPDEPWAAGDYRIVVEAALEDRAGNSIEKPFEVDVFEEVEAKVTAKEISVPFRVRE